MNSAILSALALLILLPTSPARAGTELGTLPPDELARSSAGPSDELIGFLLFDPASVSSRMPPGIRLLTLEEKARGWPRLASYLEKYPGRRGWAWSYFEIIGIHDALYDTMEAEFDSGRGGMAVWYPEVVRTDETDTRPLGEQDLALGSWVSDAHLVDYMRSRGFPATPAEVSFDWDETRASGELKAEGLSLHGECRLEGEAFTPKWAQELHSYQTLWTPAGEGDTFEIVTWSGHRSRRCRDVVWRVSGTHPFARLFNDPAHADASFYPTEFSFGYTLRSALYARDPAVSRGNLYTRIDEKLAADPALAQQLGHPGPQMQAMKWLLGEWDVTAQVHARQTPAAAEQGVSRMTLELGGTLFKQQDSYPSGTQDLGFLSYSPVTKSWTTVALDSVGNAVVIHGQASGKGLVFEGDTVILGVPTHLRQTLERESDDAYVVMNEERTAAGDWTLLDTYRYKRRRPRAR